MGYLDQISSRKKRRTSKARGGQSQPTVQQLESEVRKLEDLRQRAGGMPVEGEKFSPFGAVLDLLQRGEFAAVAGIEEGLAGGTPREIAGAIGREAFSGVPFTGLEGRKRTFTEMLEDQGAPEMGKLSDLAPWLYSETGEGLPLQRGGGLDPTGRGALGLAGGILIDPTTYATFGYGAARKVAGKAVRRKAWRKLEGEALESTKVANAVQRARETSQRLKRGLTENEIYDVVRGLPLREGHEAGILAGTRQLAEGETLTRLAAREAARVVADAEAERIIAAGGKAAQEILAPSAMRWMGLEVPGSAAAIRAVKKATGATLRAPARLPVVGEFVSRATATAKEAVLDPVVRLFDNFAGVAPGIRQIARAARGRALNEMSYAKSRWAQTLIKQENLKLLDRLPREQLVKVVDAYEEAGLEGVRAVVKDHADADKLVAGMEYFRTKMSEILEAEQRAGVKDAKVVDNYFGHYYENSPDEWHRLTRINGGTRRGAAGGDLGKNLEQRVFKTLKQGVKATDGKLRPVYSPSSVLLMRGNSSIDSLALHSYAREMEALAGMSWGDISRGLEDIGTRLITPEVEAVMKIASTKKRDMAVRALSESMRREYFARSMRKITNRHQAAKFLEKWADHIDEFPKRMLTDEDLDLAGVVISGFGKEYQVPAGVARDLTDLNKKLFDSRDLNQLLRGVDALTNFWKTWMTSIFPSFHFRNLYSNQLQMFARIGMHSLDPALHAESVRLMTPGFRNGTVDLGGMIYEREFLYDALRARGIINDVDAMFEYTGRSATLKKGAKYNPAELGRQFGTTVETEARLALALHYLRRGSDLDEAAEQVNKVLFDYAHGLSPFERNVMRRVIPFYTWTSRNIPLMAENLRRRPGLLSAEMKPFVGREDENQKMSAWDSRGPGGDRLYLRLMGDGKTVQMMSGVDVPLANLDLIWGGSADETMKNWMNMMHPVMKTGFEQALGISFFTGRKFDRKTTHGIGRMIDLAGNDWVKKALGWQKDEYADGSVKYTVDERRFSLLFQSFIMSRLVSSTDRAWRIIMRDSNGDMKRAMLAIAMRELTGFENREVNLTESQYRQLKTHRDDLYESLKRSGLAKSFEKTYIPKETANRY